MKEQTILVADTSSYTIRAAIFKDNALVAKVEKQATPLENFFPILKELFDSAKICPKDVSQYWFCGGTGSVLGIRSASVSFCTMAFLNNAKIKTFKLFETLYALAKSKGIKEPFTLYCGSRKGCYNICANGNAPKESAAADFEGEKIGDCYFIKQRNAESIAENSKEFNYNITNLFETLDKNPALLTEQSLNIPDALLLSKREFAKWNSQAHI